MDNIILFRVPTYEILEELIYRTKNGRPSNFEDISSKALLEHITNERTNSFRY